ncbi:MAG: acyl carrier protein [Acidobacteria bacterium]|nr:MAG: acyl carrier protein [Acidobacteriota bacterium]
MTTNSEPSAIDQALLAFIRKQFLYDRTEVELTPESRLFQESIIDSVGILQLVGFVENTFGVTLRPDDLVLKNFETIAAVRTLVLNRL